MFRASPPLLAVAAIAVALTASGCTAPAPEPTPTGFASEAEAFAAAEATYRAYIDAVNRVDLADPDTFEDVLQFTEGEMNSAERKSLSEMHANGWAVDGDIILTAVDHGSVERVGERTTVRLLVCSDVSGIALTDAGGASRVEPDRPVIQAEEIHVSGTSLADLRVIATYARDGDPAC